ncbi:hypothetical protein EDB86DRAFT_2828566 [Lactarius hatsudake]|nr:hypothetical protein EDB86DRAFT_2828566 [Lactarius hatsudake]
MPSIPTKERQNWAKLAIEQTLQRLKDQEELFKELLEAESASLFPFLLLPNKFLVIGLGNPWVDEGYLYPYLAKPVPVTMGMGQGSRGSTVLYYSNTTTVLEDSIMRHFKLADKSTRRHRQHFWMARLVATQYDVYCAKSTGSEERKSVETQFDDAQVPLGFPGTEGSSRSQRLKCNWMFAWCKHMARV